MKVLLSSIIFIALGFSQVRAGSFSNNDNVGGPDPISCGEHLIDNDINDIILDSFEDLNDYSSVDGTDEGVGCSGTCSFSIRNTGLLGGCRRGYTRRDLNTCFGQTSVCIKCSGSCLFGSCGFKSWWVECNDPGTYGQQWTCSCD